MNEEFKLIEHTNDTWANDIQELEEDINNLNEIMNEMNRLVIEQEPQINETVQHIEESKDAIQKATKYLTHTKKSNYSKYIGIIITSVLLGVVSIVLL